MIRHVEFNTIEKAQKCFEQLGKRAIDVFYIEYGGIRISRFEVHYLTI